MKWWNPGIMEFWKDKQPDLEHPYPDELQFLTKTYDLIVI